MHTANELGRLLGDKERHPCRLEFSSREVVVGELVQTSEGFTALGGFSANLPARGFVTCTITSPNGLIKAQAAYHHKVVGQLELHFSGALEITQRRQHFRIPVSIPVTVEVPLPRQGQTESFRAQIQDLSITGCLLALGAPLTVGAIYQVRLPAVYEGLTLTVEAVNNRHHGTSQHLTGCRFVRLTPDLQRQVLQIVLAEMERHKQGVAPERSTMPPVLNSKVDQARMLLAELSNLLSEEKYPDPAAALRLTRLAMDNLLFTISTLTVALPPGRKEYTP
jgi:hypothetical protein